MLDYQRMAFLSFYTTIFFRTRQRSLLRLGLRRLRAQQPVATGTDLCGWAWGGGAKCCGERLRKDGEVVAWRFGEP